MDENGRQLIRGFLRNKTIVDLGCRTDKITDDAIGVDKEKKYKPDVVGEIEKFQIKGFDGVCMSHSLEHIVDTRKLLKRIYDELPLGGRIAIITPDGEAVEPETLGDAEKTHEMLFTAITLRKYLEHAGFMDVISKYYERPYAYKQTRGIFAGGIK